MSPRTNTEDPAGGFLRLVGDDGSVLHYGLGCWPDAVAPDGTTEVVGGNSGKGFHPWIDLTRRTWGIVGVQDDRGADLAVPASQRVQLAAQDVLAR